MLEYMGEKIFVVYDAKTGYDLTYGCTKRDVEDECTDSWVLVKARKRRPDAYVINCAEREMKRLYDLSFTEMTFVSHKNHRSIIFFLRRENMETIKIFLSICLCFISSLIASFTTFSVAFAASADEYQTAHNVHPDL